MDKKLAEEEAVRKAKDTQAAAGKNSGMSGRDLVSSPGIESLQNFSLIDLLVHVQSRMVRRR